MPDDARQSPLIPILVAVIGLAGSLAVAWVTTQAKFDRELADKQAEITRIKQDFDAAERRMADRQKELDAKVDAVDKRLKELDAQIDLAKSAASKVGELGVKAAGKLIGAAKDKAGQ